MLVGGQSLQFKHCGHRPSAASVGYSLILFVGNTPGPSGSGMRNSSCREQACVLEQAASLHHRTSDTDLALHPLAPSSCSLSETIQVYQAPGCATARARNRHACCIRLYLFGVECRIQTWRCIRWLHPPSLFKRSLCIASHGPQLLSGVSRILPSIRVQQQNSTFSPQRKTLSMAMGRTLDTRGNYDATEKLLRSCQFAFLFFRLT